MFKINPETPYQSGATPILTGARFGCYQERMTFIMTSDVNPNPFHIDVYCIHDGSEASPGITSYPIVGDRVKVEIKNPYKNGTTSFQNRQQILYLTKGNLQLTFSFLIIQIANTPNFLLYYEFYEEPFNIEAASQIFQPKG